MKFGEKTILRLTEMDKKGRGCGEINGRRACAYFAAPGETIEAVLASRKRGELLLRTERVISASPRRIEPRCKYAGRCGGCAWQQFDYGYQLELKRDLVNAALAKGGVDARIEAVTACPELFYYRNRMDYCIGPRGELGLKEPGRWNAHLDLDACYLLSPPAVEIMAKFRDYLRAQAVVPWDNVRQTGFVRYLVIREGKNTGERMVTIVTADGELPAKKELIGALAPLATTVYHGVNPLITDISVAARLELLCGAPYLREQVADRTFFIHPNSFFQTNTAMAAELLRTVKDFIAPQPPDTLLDLYCGVGFFGISLAGLARRVVGVESDASAIDMARTNAAANGISNADFHAAQAESLVWEKEKPDAVIVDPPRSGLHPRIVSSLMAHLPANVVYVSCNYESFVRDWTCLQKSYSITRLQALDLFPHSPHVELAALLKRR